MKRPAQTHQSRDAFSFLFPLRALRLLRALRAFSLALFLLSLTACATERQAAQTNEFFLRDGERVVFLGDSITQNGAYIQYIDAYLTTRFPQHEFNLTNLGLSSETASGLSEADHPGARPNIHDRLERGLAATKPSTVTFCYGMNDGIYHPFSDERFDAYQQGVLRLIERLDATGARVVAITPPIFDPLPVGHKLVDEDASEFGYKQTYRNYDDVLHRYASWVMSLEPHVDGVVDLHTPMHELTAVRRKQDEGFTLSPDGVHPNPFGHWMIAQPILLAWGAPAVVEDLRLDAKDTPGEVRFVAKSKLPMPVDPRWDIASVDASGMTQKLNRYTFTVTSLPAAKYRLSEGRQVLGDFTREQLAAGIDLLELSRLSTNQRAAQVLTLIQKQRGMLDPAWRAAWVKPTVSPPAKSLEQVQAEAAALETEIRKMAQPVQLDLRLAPVE